MSATLSRVSLSTTAALLCSSNVRDAKRDPSSLIQRANGAPEEVGGVAFESGITRTASGRVVSKPLLELARHASGGGAVAPRKNQKEPPPPNIWVPGTTLVSPICTILLGVHRAHAPIGASAKVPRSNVSDFRFIRSCRLDAKGKKRDDKLRSRRSASLRIACVESRRRGAQPRAADGDRARPRPLYHLQAEAARGPRPAGRQPNA